MLMTGEPRFRIQAVVEMTGVSAHTLRAWERRYGVPSPARSDSAYRLYSPRDIDQVRRIRALCDQGLSVSEAAALAKSGKPTEPASAVDLGSVSHAQAVRALVAAATVMDGRELARLLALASTLGPACEVLDNVLRPALVRVGELWHCGEISVAHEHLFTELAGSTLRDWIRLKQPASPRGLVLLGCFAEEEHVMGLYAAALHLADAGFRTTLLGSRTPPEAVRAARQTLSPDLVGLSLTFVGNLERARDLVRGYAAACGSVPWLVGGAGTLPIRSAVGAAGGRVAPEQPRRFVALASSLIAGESKRP